MSFLRLATAARASAPMMQTRGLFSTGSQDPVVGVFLAELKKIKAARAAKKSAPTADELKLQAEIEKLMKLEGLAELGVKVPK